MDLKKTLLSSSFELLSNVSNVSSNPPDVDQMGYFRTGGPLRAGLDTPGLNGCICILNSVIKLVAHNLHLYLLTGLQGLSISQADEARIIHFGL